MVIIVVSSLHLLIDSLDSLLIDCDVTAEKCKRKTVTLQKIAMEGKFF